MTPRHFIATVASTRRCQANWRADQQAREWRDAGMPLAEIARRQGLSMAGAHYAVRRATPDEAMFSRVMRGSLRHRRWLSLAAPQDYRQTVWCAVVAASSYQTSGVPRDRMRLAMRLAGSLLDELAHDLGFTRRAYSDGRRWEKAETSAGNMADMDDESKSWTEWRHWARRYDGRSRAPKGPQ